MKHAKCGSACHQRLSSSHPPHPLRHWTAAATPQAADVEAQLPSTFQPHRIGEGGLSSHSTPTSLLTHVQLPLHSPANLSHTHSHHTASHDITQHNTGYSTARTVTQATNRQTQRRTAASELRTASALALTLQRSQRRRATSSSRSTLSSADSRAMSECGPTPPSTPAWTAGTSSRREEDEEKRRGGGRAAAEGGGRDARGATENGGWDGLVGR